MGVGVDQPGEHQAPRRVDLLGGAVGRAHLLRRADGDDLAVPYGDRAVGDDGARRVDGQYIAAVHQQIGVLSAHFSSLPYSVASRCKASNVTRLPRATPSATTARCGS